jgi:sortase A
MQAHDQAIGRSAGLLRRAIAAVLVVAGIAMLAWSAVLLIDARVSQQAARRSLELATRLEPPARPGLPAEDEPMPAPAAIVVPGSPIGELLIPRVRLSSIILQGSDAQTLRRGPGHIEQTALPGERGNSAIAGHRDTFFRPLRDVRVGDDVFLNTPVGSVHYRITSAGVVGAHDLSVLDPTERSVLTLITCYPFWVLGPAPDRFVVRAERVGESRSPAARPPARSSDISIDLAALDRLTPPPASAVPRAAVLDDETLIRAAIERFRGTYNARLVRDNERRPQGLLTFSNCDVAIAGDEAEVHCASVAADTVEPATDVWTLYLARAGGTWTIKSVAVIPRADRDASER